MQSAGKHFTVTLKSLSVVAFSTTRGQKTIRVKQKRSNYSTEEGGEKTKEKKDPALWRPFDHTQAPAKDTRVREWLKRLAVPC